MLGRIWAIALNTFREAARIRVLYGIARRSSSARTSSRSCSAQMSIHEETRVARDIGLAGISLFGSLTAIFLGVFLLYTEVQRRTIHAIVSKPIERWEFVVGKYARHGARADRARRPVRARDGRSCCAVQGVGVIARRSCKAIVLAWVEVLTVAAIAIFFSSFSTPFLSGIFALAPRTRRSSRSRQPRPAWRAIRQYCLRRRAGAVRACRLLLSAPLSAIGPKREA